MAPGDEVLCLIVEVFQVLGLAIKTRINHRCLLHGMFVVEEVPNDTIRLISSSIDKLDRLPWDRVKEEMLHKGLFVDIADRPAKYFSNSPTASSMAQALDHFKQNQYLHLNEQIRKVVDDMELLLEYLTAYKVVDSVAFDLTLACGLDYYTGLIYKVAPDFSATDEFTGGKHSKIGNIAVGGRYDKLVRSFSSTQMPCVGASFGIDRILTMLSIYDQTSGLKLQERRVDAWLIASGGRTAILERMRIALELR